MLLLHYCAGIYGVSLCATVHQAMYMCVCVTATVHYLLCRYLWCVSVCVTATLPTVQVSMCMCVYVTATLPTVQVSMVCQRMLKEREDQVRVEYDKILQTKLAGPSSPFSPFLNTECVHVL